MSFITSESGAVTVDWVVLTAALVGLGLATMGVVSSGVEDTSGDIDTQLKSSIVSTSFFGPPGHTIDTYAYDGCPGGIQGAFELAGALHAEGWTGTHANGQENGEPYANAKYVALSNNYDDSYLTYNAGTLQDLRANDPDTFNGSPLHQTNLALIECVIAEKGI